MAHGDKGRYKEKRKGSILDPKIARSLEKKISDGKISCARATAIAAELGVSMNEVGVSIDLMEIELEKCQLGLFGYGEKKLIVKPADNVPVDLEKVIRNALAGGRLPCAAAWRIAEELGVAKMDVSSACETLKIKIKPCQLGAF
ncbi:MAG TPA: hypothetical protein VLZ07_02075 [Syntrophales bacterium]|nr:hypothetical protein [Syntrophales bacterium]